MSNSPYQPLKGRIALITGGSRGIGAGITRKLAAWGCTVCVNYVDRPDPARRLAAELREQGVTVTLHRADLALPEEIETLLQSIQEQHGGLDILIQNAGAAKFARLEDASLSDWEFVQNTNSRATWLLAKYAIPLMRDRAAGRFITITNSSTVRIIPRGGLFAAAKAGIETLTEYLSYELAPYGIVANCVRPGLVATDLFKIRPDFKERMKQELATSPWKNGRTSTVESSAAVVAMLCLDEAAWIAGQTITVDGGFRLWGHLGRAADAADANATKPAQTGSMT